jgi:hypothetical protein
MVLLYTAAILLAGWAIMEGFDYYQLTPLERPHTEKHAGWKPGGTIGHGLGILGSTMILMLFFYSARKRCILGLRFGHIRQWLNLHIFLGLMGPLYVTLHTAFKFGGIVAVSYFSMVAVVVSGIVGRYIYVQIPRALSGEELTAVEMDQQSRHLYQLLEAYNLDAGLLEKIRLFTEPRITRRLGLFSVIPGILLNDLLRPARRRRLRALVRNANGSLRNMDTEKLIRIINSRALLLRKIELLSTIQQVFHIWHVVHKPFATVMLVIMLVHVSVAVLFGYRWIFG